MNQSDLLKEEYRLRFAGQEAYREAVWRILCCEFFSDYIDERDAVLDLGAGWGEFSRNIRAKSRFAMDMNPDCKSRLEGIANVLLQSCSDPWSLPSSSLDVVFTSNFLEHLPDKGAVERTLAEAYRCLRPGGRLLAMGPNIRYVGGRYWDFWDHHLPLTHLSLAEVLRMSGFRVDRTVERFLPFTMSQGRPVPLTAVRLYLRLPWLWRWFGAQFFIVASRE